MTVADTEERVQRCVLCPAGCSLELVPTGPDAWRVEYPLTAGTGLCPRGSALGELLGHHRRIREASVRDGDVRRPAELAAALRAVLDAAAGKTVTLLVDGNLPWEQLTAVADWADAWPDARLCLVIEPAEHQALLGLEASGADHLSQAQLADRDGFLIIGDVFAANPRCARAVLDCHKVGPGAAHPIVVIDSAAGTASKFATHRIPVAPGMELAALAAVAVGAGVQSDLAGSAPAMSVAAAAGAALATAERPGVLIAAEYGRTDAWRQIGCLAGELATARGGAAAVQTSGANALAAVRLAGTVRTVSLAEALAADNTVRVAVGCDLLGLLGRDDLDILAAAAALPNATTATADVVLPIALPGEYGGTYLFDGTGPVRLAALTAAPAGVPTPAELVAELARAAGIAEPAAAARPLPERLNVERPAAVGEVPAPAGPVLLFAREAANAGSGELTAHASWQSARQPLPALRLSPDDAKALGVLNLAAVTVRCGAGSVRARARVAPELAPGTLVLPEGVAQMRALVPSRADADQKRMVTDRVSPQVEG